MINEFIFQIRTFRKDLQIAMSYPLQFIFSFLSIFISFIFLYLFSRLVDQGQNSILETYEVSYFQFLFAGIVVAEITSIYLNTMPNTIKTYQQTGVFEQLMLSGKSEISIILASLNYPAFKLLIRIICYLLLYYLVFGELNFINISIDPLTALFLFILCMIGISLFGSAVTIFLKGSSIVPQGYLLISSLLGGVLFPIEMLPNILQKISVLLPTTQFLEVIRNTTNNSDNSLIILFVMAVLLILLGSISVKAALKNAKKNGNLLFH